MSLTASDLNAMSPTGQVAELAKEILSDGALYKRSTLCRMIRARLEGLGFPAPSEGQLTGGIRTMGDDPRFVRMGRGCYQMVGEGNPVQIVQNPRAAAGEELGQLPEELDQILKEAVSALQARASRVNFFSMDDGEVAYLVEVKRTMQQLDQLRWTLWEKRPDAQPMTSEG